MEQLVSDGPVVSAPVTVVTLYPVTGPALTGEPVSAADRYRVTRTPATDLDGPSLIPSLEGQGEIRATSQLAYVGNELVAHVVTVTGVGDALGTVVQVAKELFDPDLPLRQAGAELVVLAGDHPTGSVPKHDSYPHQVVVLPAVSRSLHRAALADERLSAPEAVRQLLFKDTDIRYDVDGAPVTTPTDTAAPRGMELWVWDTMTVVEGLESVRDDGFAQGRLRQLVDVNVQVLAARLAASAVRQSVLSRIADETATGVPSDAERSRRLEALRELRRRLVNDVNVLISGLAVEGGRPARSYHASLVAETGIRSDLDATESLLADLVRIGELDQSHQLIRDSTDQARKTTDLLDTSRAIRVVGTVFATVSIGLATSSLFTGIAAVPKDAGATWVGGVPHATVWAAAVTGVALLLGACLAVAAPSIPAHARRTALLLSGVFGVAAVTLGAKLWSAAPGDAVPLFSGLMASTAAAALLLAYGVRFERS